MEPLEQLKDMSNRLSHLNNAEEVKSQTLHLQTDCPDCGGSGWIWSRDDNGIPYCEECHCGIRKKMILQNQLQFAEMPDMYKECRFSNMKSSVYQLPESKEIFIQAAKAVKYWIENIQQMQKQGIGLYIYSNTKGSGKTRLVCSMANEMIEKHQKLVLICRKVIRQYAKQIGRHDCHKCIIYTECEHDFARCPELWKDISL